MTYVGGQTVCLGDVVNLGNDERGTVVGLIDQGEYAIGYAQQDWEFLQSGLLVHTQFGDIRFEAPDKDVELSHRT